MVKLQQIRTADRHYPFVEQLFLSAFPEVERRDIDMQRHNVDNNPLFHCVLATDDTTPIGLFCYWDFGRYCYGEHFATDSALRNHGLGSQVLRAILQQIQKPLVIEVEMPDNDISKRRIAFYQRNGMTLWNDYNYVQPSYRPQGESLPMLLMASDGLTPEQDFNDVVRTIHQQVYGIDTNRETTNI